MEVKVIISVILHCLAISNALIEPIDIPYDYQDCYDKIAAKVNASQVVGHMIYWHCKEKCSMKLDMTYHYSNFSSDYSSNTTQIDWFENLLTNLDIRDECDLQKIQPRMRREIRRLTKSEWKRLTDAINKLKETPYLGTNRYDYLASFHTGAYVPTAHFGPNFLPWHRLYLVLFESALREIDPTVTLPYWDVTIDAEMKSPIESVMWSELLMGNADGEVTTGPFKNWQTPAGPLFRNIGQFGSLFEKDFLENLFTRTTMEEISTPTAAFQYNFEFRHGAPHVFVDGIFGRINTAAYDPIFFIYHCFVDYVYQKFREVSEKAGVDIENDWTSEYSPLHAPGLLSGFGNHTHIQGRSKYYTNCIYQYEDSPTCSANVTSDCNSDYLWCNKTSSRCASFSETEYVNMSCRGQTDFGFVNSFCVGGVCDTNEWVYFPVQVIQFRPPGHGIAKTRKIKNNYFEGSDIYEASADSDLATSPEGYELKTYGKCKGMHKYDNVIVETNGINYYGEYQEVAMTDTRLPLSTATVYIAAKKPTNESDTTFTISGADKCGRECKIMYRQYGTGSFYPCSGSFRLTNQSPLMYRDTVPDVEKDMWNVHYLCPSEAQKAVYIKIVCDYSKLLPWDATYWKKK